MGKGTKPRLPWGRARARRQPNMAEREVQRADTFDDVRRAYATYSAEPLLLAGIANDWPLIADGALSELRRVAGTATVQGLKFDYDDGVQTTCDVETMSLDELLTRAGSNSGTYLQWRDLPHPPGADECGGAPAVDAHEAFELMRRVRRPGCIDASSLRQANAWIGTSRTSHLHFDGLDNVIVVAYGMKEVILFAPSTLPELYPDPNAKWQSAARSTLYLRPGDTDFPRLRAAPRLRATLTAGDAMWIPSGWWHEVLTPRLTIAFNVVRRVRMPASTHTTHCSRRDGGRFARWSSSGSRATSVRAFGQRCSSSIPSCTRVVC